MRRYCIVREAGIVWGKEKQMWDRDGGGRDEIRKVAYWQFVNGLESHTCKEHGLHSVYRGIS